MKMKTTSLVLFFLFNKDVLRQHYAALATSPLSREPNCFVLFAAKNSVLPSQIFAAYIKSVICAAVNMHVRIDLPFGEWDLKVFSVRRGWVWEAGACQIQA